MLRKVKSQYITKNSVNLFSFVKKGSSLSKEMKLKKIYDEIGIIEKKLEELVKEHDKYTLDNEGGAMQWLESFPIDNLYESLERDMGRPMTKLSVKDFAKKKKIRKEYTKLVQELGRKKREFTSNKIDLILSKIK